MPLPALSSSPCPPPPPAGHTPPVPSRLSKDAPHQGPNTKYPRCSPPTPPARNYPAAEKSGERCGSFAPSTEPVRQKERSRKRRQAPSTLFFPAAVGSTPTQPCRGKQPI